MAVLVCSGAALVPPGSRWLGRKNILGCLIRGPSPISSASAVERYSRWAAKAANEAAALRSRMDETLMAVFHQLTSGEGSDEVFSHFAELGRLGARLGDGIGVPARPHIPRGLGQDILGGTRSGAAVKCAGAGDELTLLLYREGALSRREIGILNRLAAGGGAMFLRVEKRGLSVEIRM